MKNQVVYKILKEKNETYENQETTEKKTKNCWIKLEHIEKTQQFSHL